MFHLKSKRVFSNALRALVCVLILAEVATQAKAAAVMRAPDSEASDATNSSSGCPFVVDDPVAVRNRMANRPMSSRSPSLGDRLRSLIQIPTGKQISNAGATQDDFARKLTFVVPVPYGIRYQAEKHRLTVNVDLSGDENQAGILLKKMISGPSGRKLVIPQEAKSKGFIQHIDIIELVDGDGKKTTVRGRVTLPPAAYAETNGEYAIVLTGHMVSPYFNDRIEHSDPTDEDPTDITTRTFKLYVHIDEIWLISPQRGIVLSNALHLSR